MLNPTIHEIHFTNASDLSVEVVSFGTDESLAKNIFNLMTNAFMRDGFILIGNINRPNFVEVVPRGQPTACFVELLSRPQVSVNMGNIVALFTILALEATQPRFLATGLCQAEVVKHERLWADAQYIAQETTPGGTVLKHALPGDRQEALEKFIAMVGVGKRKTQLCPDGTQKWVAFDEAGIITYEFVEVQK